MPTAFATGVIDILLTLDIFRTIANTVREGSLLNLLAEKMFYRLEPVDVRIADKSYRLTVLIGTSCTTYAMDIVFSIVWHIEVDDDTNIVNIYSSRIQ